MSKATFVIGGEEYRHAYVIDQDGLLYGPFKGEHAALAFAFDRLEPPYTLRELMTPTYREPK